MRRILFLVALAPAAPALAACRAPRPLAPGEFVVPRAYAVLFEKYRRWEYNVATTPADETAGEPDEPATSVPVSCKADRVKLFRGGVTSHITCNLPHQIEEDTGSYPLVG